MNALATRVLLDDGIGARSASSFCQGERLYRAHTPAGDRRRGAPRAAGVARSHPCRRRVQFAATADAVGHRSPRRASPHGIEPRAVLPGVGTNLQDRYEVGVVNRMSMPILARVRGRDLRSRAIRSSLSGQIAAAGSTRTNGAVLTLFRRSSREVPLPDLFCMAHARELQRLLPGLFRGLRQGSQRADVGRAQGAHRAIMPAA